jgi:hypothetical protein
MEDQPNTKTTEIRDRSEVRSAGSAGSSIRPNGKRGTRHEVGTISGPVDQAGRFCADGMTTSSDFHIMQI